MAYEYSGQKYAMVTCGRGAGKDWAEFPGNEELDTAASVQYDCFLRLWTVKDVPCCAVYCVSCGEIEFVAAYVRTKTFHGDVIREIGEQELLTTGYGADEILKHQIAEQLAK